MQLSSPATTTQTSHGERSKTHKARTREHPAFVLDEAQLSAADAPADKHLPY
jgi:hypothetical protein